MSNAGKIPKEKNLARLRRAEENNTKLRAENAELMRLQSTYAITLSALLCYCHEEAGEIVGVKREGNEYTFFLPVMYLENISESAINIKAENHDGEQGAFISLILPGGLLNDNGQKTQS